MRPNRLRGWGGEARGAGTGHGPYRDGRPISAAGTTTSLAKDGLPLPYIQVQSGDPPPSESAFMSSLRLGFGPRMTFLCYSRNVSPSRLECGLHVKPDPNPSL